MIDFEGDNDEEFHEYLKEQLGDEFDIDRDESPQYAFINGIYTLL